MILLVAFFLTLSALVLLVGFAEFETRRLDAAFPRAFEREGEPGSADSFGV
jgi:hypothetical protein